MSYTSERAEIRFGCGLMSKQSLAPDAGAFLGRLTSADTVAARYPIERFDVFQTRIAQERQSGRMARDMGSERASKAAARARRDLRKEAQTDAMRWMGHTLLRRATTADGFRERLTAFWADHFTVIGKGGLLRYGAMPYVEQAIRPHVAGSLGDMLRAVATAPMMLIYLDQDRSAGPNSARARSGRGGVNENLAREMLELHTVGLGAGYDQNDVIELAHLLAGLSVSVEEGFVFRRNATEPGAETVLGVSYGADGPGRLEDVMAALDDLARHPATAEHLARKLAVHFVGDNPAPGLVAAMASAYREGQGDLMAVYAAMLDHPAAWEGPGNVKRPVDFVGSALRALRVDRLPLRQSAKFDMLLHQPLMLMGQPWDRPEGPDGWPEADDDWITPQRLAGRLQWALNVPPVLLNRLPDPREFVRDVLAPGVPEELLFAARAAETRAEGIAVILSSPAFQRM